MSWLGVLLEETWTATIASIPVFPDEKPDLNHEYLVISTQEQNVVNFSSHEQNKFMRVKEIDYHSLPAETNISLA
jgi:hypothetical protein